MFKVKVNKSINNLQFLLMELQCILVIQSLTTIGLNWRWNLNTRLIGQTLEVKGHPLIASSTCSMDGNWAINGDRSCCGVNKKTAQYTVKLFANSIRFNKSLIRTAWSIYKYNTIKNLMKDEQCPNLDNNKSHQLC